MMRQLVGPPIQLVVGQLGVLTDHGNGVRSVLDLSFDPLVQTPLQGIVGLGVVPCHHYLLAFDLG